MALSAIFIQVELPTVIGLATSKATRPSSDLPELVDPTKRLNNPPPMSIYTMKQTRLEGHNMPLHAATDPFPLFPEQPWHTRVPFKIDVRKLLEVLDRTSELPVIAWCHDNFPLVYVIFISDCTEIASRETALRTPSGRLWNFRTTAVMQGRCTEGRALKALDGREHLSMVTCRGGTFYSSKKKKRGSVLAKRPYETPVMKHFLNDRMFFVESISTQIQKIA
ncbi:hypothetical protein BO85DRAFT_460101 [Aspergillus piperis CBS 112811]|uniref:Uncharacterized protein n=1 Tax=Aspergillus piperis CBS 112811 TaxID=1448313 RepID=A0A8G1QZR2_9EURO|nr:hypothetical protein BO85DRAFT_460101 [Aspergillus piperis CBS 112811]RAH56724.1 hypothetical protein BO85DRAFT_460101 [Aspergillus piperis CBS 112811]